MVEIWTDQSQRLQFEPVNENALDFNKLIKTLKIQTSIL